MLITTNPFFNAIPINSDFVIFFFIAITPIAGLTKRL